MRNTPQYSVPVHCVSRRDSVLELILRAAREAGGDSLIETALARRGVLGGGASVTRIAEGKRAPRDKNTGVHFDATRRQFAPSAECLLSFRRPR